MAPIAKTLRVGYSVVLRFHENDHLSTGRLSGSPALGDYVIERIQLGYASFCRVMPVHLRTQFRQGLKPSVYQVTAHG